MIDSEFKPGFFHPYYFIRKELLKKVEEYQHVLNGKLLDFGCGSKPYRAILKNVKEYIGVDFVNEGHPHDNEDIDVYYDGHTIPLEDKLFDSGLSSEVFEHVFNIDEVLKEINRVLKPGAPLLVTCPFVWKEHEVPNDFARYSHFALQYLFEKNGFNVEIKDKGGAFIEALIQLQVLYFYDSWYPKVRRIPVLNWIFRLFFIALPNCVGFVLAKILPKNKSLYLSNIIIARKKA
jgi:SAM-dependent methyltransferase